MIRLDLDAAVQRAQELAAAPSRRLLGITGPPGAGKSTLAALVRDKVDGAVLVGMDAFHLAHSTLAGLDLIERKGAPCTFDAVGYVALLRRIVNGEDATIWAPEFRREIEDAISGAVAVRPEARLVVTEGNYLLLPDQPWCQVRELADEIWYVDLPDGVRHNRLAARHEEFGRSAEQARQRTLGSDEENARLVRATRDYADVVVVPD
ncbi:nucleoside/nucleotide kinase family protein [Micromonospora sp. NPDC005113]